jgi:C6 transcription factor Pro1
MYLVQYSMPFLTLLAGQHSNQNPYPSYSAPPVPVPVSVLVPHHPSTPAPTQVPAPPQAPISFFTSALSPSYHQQYAFEEEEHNPDADQLNSAYLFGSSLNQYIAPFMNTHQSGLVSHYLRHVLQRQYLLADTSIAEFIIHTVRQNPAMRDAVCLLASLHRASQQGHVSTQTDALLPYNEASIDYVKTYQRIYTNLLRTSAASDGYGEGEAMAGLFVVSAFLFRGGLGAWQDFLSVAADWVFKFLNRRADNPADIILKCTDAQQFIIKTTFWFDILASTTRLQPPRFLEIYRKLWSRNPYVEGAGVGADANTTATTSSVVVGSSSSSSSRAGPSALHMFSMMSVMGCSNQTALAIAEISDLAYWKDDCVRQGSLSVPKLVDRGRSIEAELLQRPEPHQPPLPPGGVYYPAGGANDLQAKRRLTADIFRATARVYLHSVLSGEIPGCPDIRNGVRETIECLRRVPAGQSNNVA